MKEPMSGFEMVMSYELISLFSLFFFCSSGILRYRSGRLVFETRTDAIFLLTRHTEGLRDLA